MFDDILDATFRVLESSGFDRTTSTRIADTAGISVGSFYQYFPNRDAAILALLERQMERFNIQIQQALAVEDDQGLDDVLVKIAEAIAQSYSICPRLPESLKSKPRPMPDIEAEGDRAERNRKLLRDLLSRHADELRSGISVREAALVISSVIEGVHSPTLRLRLRPVDTAQAAQEFLYLLRAYLPARPPV